MSLARRMCPFLRDEHVGRELTGDRTAVPFSVTSSSGCALLAAGRQRRLAACANVIGFSLHSEPRVGRITAAMRSGRGRRTPYALTLLSRSGGRRHHRPLFRYRTAVEAPRSGWASHSILIGGEVSQYWQDHGEVAEVYDPRGRDGSDLPISDCESDGRQR